MGPRRKNTNLKTKGKIVATQSDKNANQEIPSPRNVLETPKATKKMDIKKPRYESESDDECKALSIKSSDSQSDSDTPKSPSSRERISDYKDSSSDSDDSIEAQIAKLREKQALKRKQRDVKCRKRLTFDGGKDVITASTSKQDKPGPSNEICPTIPGPSKQLERRDNSKETNPVKEGQEIKIKDIKENIKQPYYIEGKLVRKSCINTYSNANKSGSVITLLLADKESSIKINAYDDAAEDIAKNTQKMSCYRFTNVKINEANIGWQICEHPYELVLENVKQMKNVEREDLKDVTEEFNFSGFASIAKMPDKKQVYVIGMISHVYEKKTWGTSKKTSERRTVKIKDYDNEEMSFTLWHKMSDLITPSDVNKTIEIRGAHTTTYQGVKSITVANAEIDIY